MKVSWRGVMPAITTPFNVDLGVDHGFLATHSRWLVDAGSVGLVPIGSLGESATLDAGEKRKEQKQPFTDDELKRMYDACPKYGATPKHKWTGDDLADFISLSIYTGLRISDVALFQIDRMQKSGASGRMLMTAMGPGFTAAFQIIESE